MLSSAVSEKRRPGNQTRTCPLSRNTVWPSEVQRLGMRDCTLLPRELGLEPPNGLPAPLP